MQRDAGGPCDVTAEAAAELARARRWRPLREALADLKQAGEAIPAPLLLAEVEALRQLGDGRAARAALSAFEERHGTSALSREKAGSIASLFGEHEEALVAFGEALLLLAEDGSRARQLRRLAAAQAEQLLLLGRPEEARRTAIAAAGDGDPNYAEISLLRRAVATAADLEQLFAYLLPLFSRLEPIGRAALFQFSMASRDTDRPDLAIAAARARFLLALRAAPYASNQPRPKHDWVPEAEVAFADVLDDLVAIGEAPFLVSGTFLGCVRDGGIIGHDKDIDLGLFLRNPPGKVRATLAASGRFRVRPVESERLIQLRHANGVVIDLFIHWEEDGLIYHEGQKGRWWNSPFTLASANFLGREVLVPTDAVRYLDENYGPGWREPDPLFETFIDTPNLVMPPDAHMIWYYFARLHDLYLAGRPGKIEKVWARLQPLIGTDGQVERDILRIRSEAAALERIACRRAAGVRETGKIRPDTMGRRR